MTITIKKTDGRWLVNNKPYSELNFSEMMFFDEFLRSVRSEQLVKSKSIVHDENFNKPITNLEKIYSI